jgi:hypothetical protein
MRPGIFTSMGIRLIGRIKKEFITRKYWNKIAILALLTFLPAAITAGHCKEQAKEESKDVKRLFGTVAKVEFVMSYIVVTCDFGYVTIFVTDDTTISRDKGEIALDEIDLEDSVIVHYYSPEPGKYVAVSIRDSTSEK